MLLVSEILENAADVAPDAVAATLDDDALTFGEIDARGEPASRTGCSSAGIGRGDRVLWWGDTSLDAVPVFAALAKIGAVFAPLNARASLAEVTPGRRVRPARACSSPAPSHADAAAELARALGVPFVVDLAEPAPRARARASISTSAIRTSSSSRAGAPAGRRASCSRTARTGCARSWARRPRPGGGGTVCMFPLFHMAGWTIALGAWQARRRGALRARSRRGDAARDHRRATAPRACIASPRCGAGSSSTASTATTCRRSSRPTPARRRRRPSCSPRSRTRSPTP